MGRGPTPTPEAETAAALPVAPPQPAPAAAPSVPDRYGFFDPDGLSSYVAFCHGKGMVKVNLEIESPLAHLVRSGDYVPIRISAVGHHVHSESEWMAFGPIDKYRSTFTAVRPARESEFTMAVEDYPLIIEWKPPYSTQWVTALRMPRDAARVAMAANC